jgi:hypothetical protein
LTKYIYIYVYILIICHVGSEAMTTTNRMSLLPTACHNCHVPAPPRVCVRPRSMIFSWLQFVQWHSQIVCNQIHMIKRKRVKILPSRLCSYLFLTNIWLSFIQSCSSDVELHLRSPVGIKDKSYTVIFMMVYALYRCMYILSEQVKLIYFYRSKIVREIELVDICIHVYNKYSKFQLVTVTV